MMKLAETGFAALGVVVLSACGGGGDALTTVQAITLTPAAVAPVVAPAPIVTATVGVAPPTANPISELPASGMFILASVASLNACPSVPFLSRSSNWSDCLAGQKFVGTSLFGAATCELLVGSNGSFTYVDNSGTYITAPSSSQLVIGSVLGTYMNRLDSDGRTSFSGGLGIFTSNDSSSVDIQITSLRSAGAANRPGSLDSATVSVRIGIGATKVCQLSGF